MTIAIAIKVDKGIVLAADSLTVANIVHYKRKTITYFNANKIYRLGKKIGIVSWASGRINNMSISDIIDEIWNESKNEFKQTPDTKSACALLGKIIFEKYYSVERKINPNSRPEFYCFVCGFNPNNMVPSICQISIENDNLFVNEVDSCVNMGGYTESLSRLINGYDELIRQELNKWANVNDYKHLIPIINKSVDMIKLKSHVNFADRGMPFQDAIDLARFLVNTAINYHRFLGEPRPIGGRCDIAIIRKRNGFRWLQWEKYH